MIAKELRPWARKLLRAFGRGGERDLLVLFRADEAASRLEELKLAQPNSTIDIEGTGA